METFCEATVANISPQTLRINVILIHYLMLFDLTKQLYLKRGFASPISGPSMSASTCSPNFTDPMTGRKKAIKQPEEKNTLSMRTARQ